MFVALHPEGVDRNLAANPIVLVIAAVALHPEGVDRNGVMLKENTEENGRPPPGGRG